MSAGDVIFKRVRFDTPSKGDPRLIKERDINLTSCGDHETDFNRFLSDYVAPRTGEKKSAHTENPRPLRASILDAAHQTVFDAIPKPSCELELSVYDSSKDAVARAKQRILHEPPANSKLVIAGAVTQEEDHSIYPSHHKAHAHPERLSDFQEPRPSQPLSEQLHKSHREWNFGHKSVDSPFNAHGVHNVKAEKEIDDCGFFLRRQNASKPISKCMLNDKNSQFKQIMKSQFPQPSSMNNVFGPINNNSTPESRNDDKMHRTVRNSEFVQSVATPGQEKINCGFVHANGIPTMIPVYPENFNIWSVAGRVPEVTPPYLIGYTPDGRGFLYPWKPNNSVELQTETCNDNGVGDKVKAIMSQVKVNQRSKDETTVEPFKEAKVAIEPTVSDLFEILKQQNEQLERLYNKMDMLLERGAINSNSRICNNEKEIPTIVPEPSIEIRKSQCTVKQDDFGVKSTEVNTIKEQLHQMSIGVMTSFEMVMTSTRQFTDTEVNLPKRNMECKAVQSTVDTGKSNKVSVDLDHSKYPKTAPINEHTNLESVLYNVSSLTSKSYESCRNEKSFGNVTLNLENYPSRQLSPEPSLRLEMKDFSGMGSAEISHSERDWTYFNKVVNNVDEILNQSPLGVSTQTGNVENRIHRNVATLRHKDTQISVSDISLSSARRVKFNAEYAASPIADATGTYTPPHGRPITETSIRINQLAKKYLKDKPNCRWHTPPTISEGGGEMDKRMLTANKRTARDDKCYRPCKATHERDHCCTSPDNILDIQALKRQPKLL